MSSWRSSNPQLKELIEQATSSAEKITSSPDIIREDVFALVDYVNKDPLGPKECIRILLKQLSNKNPRIVFQTIGVIDTCVNNCGKRFHIELSCREFDTEVRKLLNRANTLPPLVAQALLAFIKKWGESKEFTGDSQLSLIPTLYRQLKKEGVPFPDTETTESRPPPVSNDPNFVSSNQEQEDIAKAIELSLRETSRRPSSSSTGNNSYSYSSRDDNRSTASSGTSMYPSFDSLKHSGAVNGNTSNTSSSGPRKSVSSYQVRALYDFEAAEDNELTFKAGEIVVVLDDSDANWWKGSNHRGEGLFPANFVTSDLTEDDEELTGRSPRGKSGKSVQFNEEVSVRKVEKEEAEVPITIDVEKIDKLIHLLHVADPTDDRPDSDELITLEGKFFSTQVALAQSNSLFFPSSRLQNNAV